MSRASSRAPADPPLRLSSDVVAILRERLPAVATTTIEAVMAEVPTYRRAFGGPMGDNIENAVQMALAGFLRLAQRGRAVDPGTPLSPAIDGAYALGRGEARSGRSADDLLAAYRVGARVAWRELSRTAVEQELPAATLAGFAELVFAYIDELSAASVAGHADELATSGRVRERYLDRLAQALLRGDAPDALAAAAERADWSPPRTLTAVILPEAQARPARSVLDRHTLTAAEDPPGLPPGRGLAVLLVPGVSGRTRARLLRDLAGRHAVVGPTRPWQEARASYQRALRGLDLLAAGGTAGALDPDEPVDTEHHLAALVRAADPDALADLRARALAPLSDLRPATRRKLEETLRAWLLHQGRRDDVAAALFVHPQTVRYRMGQVRELYGDRLEDPRVVLDLVLALG